MSERDKERSYAVKASAWKLLDPANPAFRPVDFSGYGKNMQADFKIKPDEGAEQYWSRVRNAISAQGAA